MQDDDGNVIERPPIPVPTRFTSLIGKKDSPELLAMEEAVLARASPQLIADVWEETLIKNGLRPPKPKSNPVPQERVIHMLPAHESTEIANVPMTEVTETGDTKVSDDDMDIIGIASDFTQVPNGVFDLSEKYDLSAVASSLIMQIVRHTFGFRTRTTRLTHKRLCDRANTSHTATVRAMQELEDKGLIKRHRPKIANGQLGVTQITMIWPQPTAE